MIFALRTVKCYRIFTNILCSIAGVINAKEQLFVELNTEEQKVYDYLLQNGKQYLDAIALECQIPVYKMATLLFNLEMKGVLRPLQGKLFEVV